MQPNIIFFFKMHELLWAAQPAMHKLLSIVLALIFAQNFVTANPVFGRQVYRCTPVP